MTGATESRDRGRQRGRAGAGSLSFVRQAMWLARAPHALRWRLETFGLYMPSFPETRPWWRINRRSLRALLAQLPGYARWLAEMQATRRTGARGFWQAHAGACLHEWEDWLAIGDER